MGPFDYAVEQAKQRWPRIRDYPFALTEGNGPGYSETYEPEDRLNPKPGNWTIQLRSPEAKRNKQNYAEDIGLESIHALYRDDPRYRQLSEQMAGTLGDQSRTYQRDKREFGTTEPYSSWLPRVQAQEYIRGGIFNNVIKNWLGPHGEGHYTPQQLSLINYIKNYLATPPAVEEGFSQPQMRTR